ncbi:MAG: GlmU family protein [Saprospiraceae bacterium]
MTHLILFDNDVREHLLPLTFLRPVGNLRIGILTVAEKWSRRLDTPASFLTQDYLAPLFPLEYGDHNLLINGSLLPTPELTELVRNLIPGQAVLHRGELLAACLAESAMQALLDDRDFPDLQGTELAATGISRLRRPTDIFILNEQEITADFELLTAGRISAPLPATNLLIGPTDRLFIEPGVTIEGVTLNTTQGPIYLGRDVLVMEGCLLRGPLAAGEQSVFKMGAKVYGPTTLGPNCKVGGEINNVVFQANSNKGHEGYLGNSVIGEWCNLGADTNCSNLKNNYAEVRLWSYPEAEFVSTGLQFCGLIMGDHCKVGINTMFNTGTVVGVAANIFGAGFVRNFVPSFSWGGAGVLTTHRLDKALATAELVYGRRGKTLGPEEVAALTSVFERTGESRVK